MEIKKIEGNKVTVAGDQTAHSLWFNSTYEFQYKFSRFYLRASGEKVQSLIVSEARVQLGNLEIIFEDAAQFEVRVYRSGRSTPYVYKPRVGQQEGQLTVPLMAKNDEVKVEIINLTDKPCRFITASFDAVFNPNTRLI